ncbi:hypothetical protein BGZ81_007586 [Podila clonocystis]|nr:hypothetical protein BGZ81_007586 [Podila clonocystis]
MSVSLSQVNLLKNCHGLQSNPDHNGQDDEDDWQAILDAMRSEISVRIKNVERNLKLGEFAKDLLWISAFGAGSPPPPPEVSIPSQSSSRSSTQESLESPQLKDALTLVRSLLPSSLNSPTQCDISSRATEDSNEDEMVDDGVLVEHEATVDDIPSSTIPFASPTALDSPPPLKLVRHIGPALEPVMTIGSSAQLSPTSGSTLSQALDIPDGLQPSITAAQQDGQYTSFPESFDEPQLAQLLARSLGLNSFGLSSSGSAAEVPENHGRPSQKKPFNPKTGFSAATTPAHRSTPSWSSQQTIYYQQQQHPPTSSSSTPPLRKRISALGLGLGLGFGLSPSSTKQNTKTHSPSSSLDSTTPSSSISQPQVSSPSSAHPQEPPGLILSSSSSSSSFYDGKGQKGKFAFNRVQLKFLPAAYRPPRRMTTNTFES